MRTKLGMLCMTIGTVLILLALFLLVYNRNEDHKAEELSAEILTELKDQIQEKQNNNSSGNTGLPDLAAAEMSAITVDGENYIGYLTIPALNLELPVMAEWSYPRLRIAPCRQSGTVREKNLVIAGHNYNSHFGRLPKLKIGDIIIFNSVNGEKTEYAVKMTELLHSDQGDAMLHSEWDMTLYTCTYNGKDRVTIRAGRQ